MMRSPMFEPLHPVLGRLALAVQRSGADLGAFPSLQVCNALLDAQYPPVCVHAGAPLRFVPQACGDPAFEAQYEPRCYLKGELQTREHNWHDLLNALVWLTFPKAKAAINARHYQSMVSGRKRGTSQRGGGRDMLTLLDESGVIVPCADDEIASLLRTFRWKELFWMRQAHLSETIGFSLFGHGLYEKALRPYVGMTGQGLILAVDRRYFQWPLERRLVHLDEALATYFASPHFGESTRELTPVPVLGVPGWWPDTAHEYFYENRGYFRPGRLLSRNKNVC